MRGLGSPVPDTAKLELIVKSQTAIEDPVFGLFEFKDRVLRMDPETEEKSEFTGFPCKVWFLAIDFQDGCGWNRPYFERDGEVLEHYLHDVGARDTTEAVLCRVNSAEAFCFLAKRVDVAEKVPTRL